MAGRTFKNFKDLGTRLIEKNGRFVNIIREEETPANAAREWEGPEAAAEPEVLATNINAEFTRFSRSLEGTTSVQRGDKRCLISAQDLPSGLVIDTSMKIVDGDRTYSIIDDDNVQPGEPIILYKLQVRA